MFLFNKPKDDLSFMTPFHDKEGTLSLVFGSPGSGKSFFAKELSIKYLINYCPVIIVDSEDEYSSHLKEYLPLVNYFPENCSIQSKGYVMGFVKSDRKNLIIFDESWRGIEPDKLLKLIDNANANNIDILFITQCFVNHDNDKMLQGLSFDYIFTFNLYLPSGDDFAGLLSPEEIRYACSLNTVRNKYSSVYIKDKRLCHGRVKKIKPSRFNLRLIGGE